MPITPAYSTILPGLVFWSTEDVLNMVRVLINDAQGGLDGQELSNAQPFTWTLLNLAYAKLQNQIEDTNVESVTYAEAIVGPLTASPNGGFDPNVQVRLGYDGYWDGANETNPEVILPGDLLQPLVVWERQSGGSGSYSMMAQNYGGLPAHAPGAYRFNLWEFRGNALYFPGTITDREIRIRYIPSLPLLQMQYEDDGTPIYPQVPLARAGEALAYGMAADWLEIRGANNAPVIRAIYNDQIRILSNKSAKRENAGTNRARGYGFGRNPRRGFYW